MFGKAGEELTSRLRYQSFKKYLQLEMGFFDDPKRSTGVLTSRLSSDASKINGLVGGQWSIMMQSLGAMGVGLGIAFYYEWRLTLIIFAFMPFLTIGSMIEMQMMQGDGATKDNAAFEEAGKCTTEATMNVQTVASLGRETTFIQKYETQLDQPLSTANAKAIVFGVAYGMSMGMIFFMYAGCFYFAAWLIEAGYVAPSNFDYIFRCLMGLVFGAMTAGQAAAAAPDAVAAKLSANRIMALLNTASKINPESKNGKTIPDENVKGHVTFKSVDFHYPSRPNVPVLKGLTLEVNPGETVALVGQSGCGKSTCIQLVERFYDGTAGSIEFDGVPVNELNVQWLRKQIGFVQQEPILFNRTIAENITYGTGNTVCASKDSQVAPDTQYTQSQIDAACVEANAKDFIQSLPSGFETGCGKKGGQLSGGQKQRVAIARALIRNPKVLLLDEATSALDTESEKIVQDALNKASKGRTVILIAHRLSTVINADKIAVVDNGQIIEIGKHDDLIKKKGAYFSLVNSQL